MMNSRWVALIIRDGWGKGLDEKSNAIFCANTPFADYCEKECPTALIKTSGLDVGLPDGNQGNSEVGHLNIGSGRIVYQSLTRIDQDIRTENFFRNDKLLDAIHVAASKRSTLHLLGLIQEEGVHAVTRHALAILELCKRQGFRDVVFHAITDGRDTPPKSALKHLRFLQDGIDNLGIGRVVSVMGRYYAMDRDNRWDRIELAYRAIIEGQGALCKDWMQAITSAYEVNETDEFIRPRVIDYKGVYPDDVLLFFNFRTDRTRQLTKAITETDFDLFSRVPFKNRFYTMTHYYDNGNFIELFPDIENKNVLGEVLSARGLKQLRISETEKYAHVTFFFNDQKNEPFKNEHRILIPSPRIATYDLKPEMSAPEVKERLVKEIMGNGYSLVVCNFANCDMVGHTGFFEKIVTAVEEVDRCTQAVVEATLKKGGVAIVTSDHGNAEQTRLPDGSPMTAHTTNPVPLSIVGLEGITIRKEGKLCDIAPTILKILNIEIPQEMTGTSLF